MWRERLHLGSVILLTSDYTCLPLQVTSILTCCMMGTWRGSSSSWPYWWLSILWHIGEYLTGKVKSCSGHQPRLVDVSSCCCPGTWTWACRVKPRPSARCLTSCCVTSPACASTTPWITPTQTPRLNPFSDALCHRSSAVLALHLLSNPNRFDSLNVHFVC